MASCLLRKNKFACRVSSVLNKDVRNYGKQFLFDENNETCWNSDAGSPQWILIDFDNECAISMFEIEFQGGFVGKDCSIESGQNSSNLSFVQSFFPEDTNSLQTFKLKKEVKAKCFKILFNNSTDFFGRIIIYKLSFYS